MNETLERTQDYTTTPQSRDWDRLSLATSGTFAWHFVPKGTWSQDPKNIFAPKTVLQLIASLHQMALFSTPGNRLRLQGFTDF